MVQASHGEGVLDPADRDLVGGALAFDSGTARTITLDLDRVHSVGPRATPEAVERLAGRTDVPRDPIRAGDRGIFSDGFIELHLKDTLAVPGEGRDRPVPAAFVRELPDVVADVPLSAAVEIMRTSSAQMARGEAAGALLG